MKEEDELLKPCIICGFQGRIWKDSIEEYAEMYIVCGRYPVNCPAITTSYPLLENKNIPQDIDFYVEENFARKELINLWNHGKLNDHSNILRIKQYPERDNPYYSENLIRNYQDRRDDIEINIKTLKSEIGYYLEELFRFCEKELAEIEKKIIDFQKYEEFKDNPELGVNDYENVNLNLRKERMRICDFLIKIRSYGLKP